MRHLVAGMSGFGRLPSPHGPGCSHVIGVCAPFTVWAVVPLLAAGIKRKILTKTIGIQPVGLDP